jgi:uncharacterized damage-inducible protein DinB
VSVLPAVTRPEPPMTGDERDMLTAWLDYQRSTLLWKCEMLDGDALVRRGVPPSSLSLLGLVRHMTYVEWHWFVHVFAGRPSPEPISMAEDPDADFNDLQSSEALADVEQFMQQCDASRAIVDDARDLDREAAEGERPISLRWIMIHMIEEYARHNGHADLLREQIDGSVGE